MKKDKKRGRPPAITIDIVKRVGTKVAQGVPLRYALASEKDVQINCDSWHKALQRNAQFRSEYEIQLAAFIEKACGRLVEDRDPANLKWILERRHSADFARKSGDDFSGAPAGASEADDMQTVVTLASQIARQLRSPRRPEGICPPSTHD